MKRERVTARERARTWKERGGRSAEDRKGGLRTTSVRCCKIRMPRVTHRILWRVGVHLPIPSSPPHEPRREARKLAISSRALPCIRSAIQSRKLPTLDKVPILGESDLWSGEVVSSLASRLLRAAELT